MPSQKASKAGINSSAGPPAMKKASKPMKKAGGKSKKGNKKQCAYQLCFTLKEHDGETTNKTLGVFLDHKVALSHAKRLAKENSYLLRDADWSDVSDYRSDLPESGTVFEAELGRDGNWVDVSIQKMEIDDDSDLASECSFVGNDGKWPDDGYSILTCCYFCKYDMDTGAPTRAGKCQLVLTTVDEVWKDTQCYDCGNDGPRAKIGDRIWACPSGEECEGLDSDRGRYQNCIKCFTKLKKQADDEEYAARQQKKKQKQDELKKRRAAEKEERKRKKEWEKQIAEEEAAAEEARLEEEEQTRRGREAEAPLTHCFCCYPKHGDACRLEHRNLKFHEDDCFECDECNCLLYRDDDMAAWVCPFGKHCEGNEGLDVGYYVQCEECYEKNERMKQIAMEKLRPEVRKKTKIPNKQ